MKNKFLEILKPDVTNLILTIVLLLSIFTAGEACGPWAAEGGSTIYPCGSFLGNFPSFSSLGFLSLLLAMGVYLFSALIVHVLKRKK